MVWPTLGSRTAKEQEQEQCSVTSRYMHSNAAVDAGSRRTGVKLSVQFVCCEQAFYPLAYMLFVGRSRCSLRTVSISASQRAPRARCRSRLGTYQKHTFRYSGYSGSSNNNITTLSLVSRSYFSRYFTTRVDSDFYPRDAVLARVLAMAPCPCLSVTSRCSIEVVGRIELVSGMEAAFDQTYTVF